MIMRDEPEGNAVYDTEFVLTYDRFDSAAEGLRARASLQSVNHLS
jgi:hypothetical protein